MGTKNAAKSHATIILYNISTGNVNNARRIYAQFVENRLSAQKTCRKIIGFAY